MLEQLPHSGRSQAQSGGSCGLPSFACFLAVLFYVLCMSPYFLWAISVPLQDLPASKQESIPPVAEGVGAHLRFLPPTISQTSMMEAEPDYTDETMTAAMTSSFISIFENAGLIQLWSYHNNDAMASAAAIARSLQEAMAARPEVQSSSAAGSSMITQEIRYDLTEAGEVFLVWGINGWHVAPETMRPRGTAVNNGTMHTPMIRRDGAFVATMQVPSGTVIEYCFRITKTREGSDIEVWDTNGYPPRNYLTVALPKRVAVVLATLNLSKAHDSEETFRTPLLARKIRYQKADAEEVFFAWGINGWRVVPETIRPPGTVLKDGVMQTPMMYQDGAFVAKVRVPIGTILDYGFLVTRTRLGKKTHRWEADGPQDFHETVQQDGITTVTSRLKAGE